MDNNGLEKGNGKYNPEKANQRNVRRLKAARVSGIVAIVITVITFILIATNQYTHLSKNARFVYVIAFVLIGVAVIVWVVLRGGKGFTRAVNEEEMRDAERKGEIWCTQEQVNIIGKIFDRYGDEEVKNCPVCGTGISISRDYTFSANVLVRKKLEGVYISRNYSNEVEQAYETVSEYTTFPNALRCSCPNCKWEAYSALYESNGEKGVCTAFDMGKLYSKRIMPRGEGNIVGTFNRK